MKDKAGAWTCSYFRLGRLGRLITQSANGLAAPTATRYSLPDVSSFLRQLWFNYLNWR